MKTSLRTCLTLSAFLLSWLTGGVSAQRNPYAMPRGNEGPVLLFQTAYGGHRSAGDLSARFGDKFSVGGGIEWMGARNFLVGTQAVLYFGDQVRTDVIANLRDIDGFIHGEGGGISDIGLRERGTYLGGHVGKLIRLSPGNHRSGLRVTVGAGFLRHKIRIQDDPQVFVPGLSGDYKKGYDRLTNGLALTQFVGYQYMSRNRMVNLLLGLEFTQGFTENRRTINFDTRTAEPGRRLDLLHGLRIAWTLPLYIGDNADEIQY
ncbi:MAG: hypothetical protein RLY31_736 [Bacteroidota bacterium]|jgi:hypothetical protein